MEKVELTGRFARPGKYWKIMSRSGQIKLLRVKKTKPVCSLNWLSIEAVNLFYEGFFHISYDFGWNNHKLNNH